MIGVSESTVTQCDSKDGKVMDEHLRSHQTPSLILLSQFFRLCWSVVYLRHVMLLLLVNCTIHQPANALLSVTDLYGCISGTE